MPRGGAGAEPRGGPGCHSRGAGPERRALGHRCSQSSSDTAGHHKDTAPPGRRSPPAPGPAAGRSRNWAPPRSPAARDRGAEGAGAGPGRGHPCGRAPAARGQRREEKREEDAARSRAHSLTGGGAGRLSGPPGQATEAGSGAAAKEQGGSQHSGAGWGAGRDNRGARLPLAGRAQRPPPRAWTEGKGRGSGYGVAGRTNRPRHVTAGSRKGAGPCRAEGGRGAGGHFEGRPAGSDRCG